MNRFVLYRRLIWATFFLGSIALLISSIYRAVTYPFTHDESLSFAIFNWGPHWANTANNHLLNTLLMQLCSFLFGNSELSLRLPNIIAHAIYLICTMLFISRFQSSLLQLVGFIAFNFNPFILDFFFFARGYGLALAFLLSSVYLLEKAHTQKMRHDEFDKMLFLSTLSGMFSVFSNFAFLNFYLPLLLASAVLLFYNETTQRLNFRWNWTMTILSAANGLFLIKIALILFQLRAQSELYFGGKTGFLADTVTSLIKASFYSMSYSGIVKKNISFLLLATFGMLIFLSFYLIVFKKEVPFFVLALTILIAAAILPILQNFLLGVLYPVTRAALYYLPLYVVTMISAFDLLIQRTDSLWKKNVVLTIFTVIAMIVGWHFYNTFELNTSFFWSYDKHNKEIISIIEQNRMIYFPNEIINLGVTWQMEPSLNFYRFTRGDTWLAPITRKPIENEQWHYIYGFENDMMQLENNYVTLAYYPDIKTILLRSKYLSP